MRPDWNVLREMLSSIAAQGLDRFRRPLALDFHVIRIPRPRLLGPLTFTLVLLSASALAEVGPAAQQSPDAIIYPHAPGVKSATAADQDGWSRAPWLVGALALAAGGTWWFLRTRSPATPGRRPAHKLAIEETKSLGNRQYLVVAAYEGKRLLLGVTPGRIKLLCELSDDEEAGL